ncbi:hypothetical protein Xbed_01432 [Xenorhabdus beddingii]|uniref:Pyocin immunity protein n=1 Tax=Xenorhabdus beddingii TaxID=40578 RepID=A0A1Y2SRE4_9GAMM|nr:DUF6392 family protein [Xenorhabdus beddingii]OTA20402.1 hypothetical protein Xbed_01432 [Xenorhabdus beddingii]
MTIDVKVLINNLGVSYKEILNSGFIPYKTKPSGDSGDDYVSLNMAKEGVYLAFHRDNMSLFNVTLTLLDDGKKNYTFPNKLPAFLKPLMSRQWVHQQFGKPEKSTSPQMIMNKYFGWVDMYSTIYFEVPVSMQLDYDLQENVKEVTFFLTSEVSW